MELATNIMAIIGFFMLGMVIPTLLKVKNPLADIYCAISFGLIAASIVLG